MTTGDTVRALEAIVLVATDPVPPTLLAQLLEVPVADIERLCRELAASYDEAGHGFELVRVAGGYRYQSRADLAPYVERFVLEGQSTRLSAAALDRVNSSWVCSRLLGSRKRDQVPRMASTRVVGRLPEKCAMYSALSWRMTSPSNCSREPK